MSLKDVKEKIAAAGGATLVAVSKMQPVEKIEAALIEGQRVFGENRVQDAAEVWPALRKKYPDIELHLIGHLQTNKAKLAVQTFDVIESLDSERLALALAEEMDAQGRRLPCLIQVNTGEEPQKGGINPADVEKFHAFCTSEAKLDIKGLMCIPPEGDIPELHFALLRKLRDELHLPLLSMGMSADYETAIRWGATHVRVGSAVFGERISLK